MKRDMKNVASLLAMLFFLLLPGCTDLDDVNNRIDNLEQRVDDIQAAVDALEDAVASGKLITSVEPIPASESNPGGWTVVFSDGSSINIANGSAGADGSNGSNGTDGITPVLKLDHDGYWIVSYDGGMSYGPVLDEAGNQVKASGNDGADGKDGEDGKDGASVQIIVNDDGFYVIQTYIENESGKTILSESVTPYTANPQCVIASISQDSVNNRVTFVFADGSSYTFPLASSFATGVMVMTPEVVTLQPGQSATLIFRVNPSDADLDFNVGHDDCQIALDVIQPSTRGTLIVASSENFTLTEIKRSADSQGNFIPGQYEATITDSNYRLGYIETAAIVVKGSGVGQLSSQPFTVQSSQLTKMVATGLPTVVLDTPGGNPIVSKDDWMADASVSVYDNTGKLDYSGPLSVKGRGNSTWKCEKKPYALKLDKKSSILGMPKHKRWCLLAEYYDKAWIRNDVALWMGNNMSDLAWTPRATEVNLVLNGEWLGLYLLTEQVKIDENRVDVGDDGFLVEVDNHASDPEETDPYFMVGHINQPIAVKDYDETAESLEYITKFMTDADNLLFSDEYLDAESGWKSIFDMDSFVEWYLVKEITKDNDAIFFSSCYMNLRRGEKLKMGPLWDFDVSMGNYPSDWTTDLSINDPEGFYVISSKWYKRMFTDPEFVAAVKNRFNHFYAERQRIYDFIDATVVKTAPAYEYDFRLWRSTASNPASFRETQIETLKGWLDQRFEWLKTEFDKM